MTLQTNSFGRPTGDKFHKINCFGKLTKSTKPKGDKETTAKRASKENSVTDIFKKLLREENEKRGRTRRNLFLFKDGFDDREVGSCCLCGGLIRFLPLPWEDHTPRCISNKNSQPAFSQPNPIPQNHEDQEKRKYNNQLKKNFEKKQKIMNETTGHCMQPPQRPTGDKTKKEICPGALRKRTPQEKEEETSVSTTGNFRTCVLCEL